MTFKQAKVILNGCTRVELRDHAFGDKEISWYDVAGRLIADGYAGSSSNTFCFDVQIGSTQFTQDETRELFQCGTLGKVKRNDTEGPDVYTQGKSMPGLTLFGVRKELTAQVTPPDRAVNSEQDIRRQIKTAPAYPTVPRVDVELLLGIIDTLRQDAESKASD